MNLGRKLRISYIGQLVVPQIFKYLIGAKGVEVRLACRFDWHDSIVPLLQLPLMMCRQKRSFFQGEHFALLLIGP